MKILNSWLTILKSWCRIVGMDTEARTLAFLQRLWELQAEAGLTDAVLARRMGVDQALVCRAKRDKPRTVGSKFLLGAGSVFPELGLLLFPELSIMNDDFSEIEEERAAS